MAFHFRDGIESRVDSGGVNMQLGIGQSTHRLRGPVNVLGPHHIAGRAVRVLPALAQAPYRMQGTRRDTSGVSATIQKRSWGKRAAVSELAVGHSYNTVSNSVLGD